jgi:UDP-N-acetyl-D-mannosaminuronic acid dehydrogenase
MKVAEALSARFGNRIAIVEPHIAELPKALADTGATLIDIDTALADCETMVVLVDHDIFKSVPADERAGKIVYDTRGIWGAA